MTSILDALRADHVRSGGHCGTCEWLETRSKKEQQEWAEAYADRSFNDAKLTRLQTALGGPGYTSVGRHRRNKHWEQAK